MKSPLSAAGRQRSILIALIMLALVASCQSRCARTAAVQTQAASSATSTPVLSPTTKLTLSPSPTQTVEVRFRSPLATPTPGSALISPLPTPTPGPPTDTPTSTPTPSPTPTYPPYTDAPFKMVFLRDGNLWLSEIGGEGERRLTDESAGWSITEYAVSPACDRIAYIPRRQDTRDAAIKQVDLNNGQVSALVGLDDRANEYGVRWLDQDHLLFHISEFGVLGDRTPAPYSNSNPFFPMIVDLHAQEYVNVDGYNLWQSDDGRYQMICFACGQGYPYECGCSFRLRDRETGQEWHIAQDVAWSTFLGWSLDNEWALFTSSAHRSLHETELVTVDMTTRSTRTITPEDKTVLWPQWSPDRRHIAFTMCERKMDERREIWVGEWMQNCDLWSIDPDGSSARLILDGGDEVHLLFASWSPDGQTLAFHQCDTTKREYPLQLGHCSLGLVKRDGSDPMVILDTVPTKAREIKWHPDGSRLLLIGSSANVNTVPVVWSVRPDGTDLRPIINDAGNVKVLCEP